MNKKKVQFIIACLTMYPICCYSWYIEMEEEPPYLWLFLGYCVITIVTYYTNKFNIHIFPRSHAELDDMDDQINEELNTITISNETKTPVKNTISRQDRIDDLI